MSFVYRTAKRDDLEQIVEIYNATIPSRQVTADTVPVSVESRIAWFEEHTPDFRPLWVAEHEGRVVGWLSFSSFYGRPAYKRTAEVSVYVHEAFRERGVGSHFVQKAIAEAPSLDVSTLLGFIFGHNETSLKLFEKFGFARWGNLPRVAVLEGIERDLVIVGRHV